MTSIAEMLLQLGSLVLPQGIFIKLKRLIQATPTLGRAIKQPKIYACGLLGTDDLVGDLWMATDFVVLAHLINTDAEDGKWISFVDLQDSPDRILLGDPSSDRIIFPVPAFIHNATEDECVQDFVMTFALMAERMLAEDTLVVVLVGHGEENGGIFVGRTKLVLGTLEKAAQKAKGNIVLINTACYSGAWTSKYWTLVAASKPGEESVSIVQSDSNKCQGGIFTSNLVSSHTDEFGIRAPCPASVDDNGFRGDQLDHDFGPASTVIPSIPATRRDLQGSEIWMNNRSDHIGRLYTSTRFTIHPHDSSICLSKIFVPLTSDALSLHKLVCCAPSPTDQMSGPKTGGRSIPNFNTTPPMPDTNLSTKEESRLLSLASTFNDFVPPSVPSEILMIRAYSEIGKGISPHWSKRSILVALEGRLHAQEKALSIARRLGWQDAVDQIGEPYGHNLQFPRNVCLPREATASGCLVSQLDVISLGRNWNGAAFWLARVWNSAGRPTVSKDAWVTAVLSYRDE